jgi:hypothetical protein
MAIPKLTNFEVDKPTDLGNARQRNGKSEADVHPTPVNTYDSVAAAGS